MKRSISIITALLLIFVLAGCANFGTTSANSLQLSKNMYQVSMGICGDLYRQGVINEAQKNHIIQVARAYQSAHNLAVDALESYMAAANAAAAARNAQPQDPTQVNKTQIVLTAASAAVTSVVSNMNVSYNDLQGLVNSIKPGSMPATIGGVI